MLEIMNPKSGYKDLNVTKNVINEKKTTKFIVYEWHID